MRHNKGVEHHLGYAASTSAPAGYDRQDSEFSSIHQEEDEEYQEDHQLLSTGGILTAEGEIFLPLHLYLSI